MVHWSVSRSPCDYRKDKWHIAVFDTALQWSSSANDVKVMAATRSTISRATTEVQVKVVYFKYTYQNVSQTQKVYSCEVVANDSALGTLRKSRLSLSLTVLQTSPIWGPSLRITTQKEFSSRSCSLDTLSYGNILVSCLIWSLASKDVNSEMSLEIILLKCRSDWP